MKIWQVIFRGECEYASTNYADVLDRASFLRKWYTGDVEIVEELQNGMNYDMVNKKEGQTMINMDSFGSNCPSNWEEIADFLNEYISEKTAGMDEQEQFEESEKIWEQFCNDEIPGCPAPEFLWYAVMTDHDDDWGTGSNFKSDAIEMARRYREDYPDTLIAVIDNHSTNPVCIAEITEF